MDKLIAKLFEGMDKNLASPETKQKVAELIESTVETRVKAKLDENVTLLANSQKALEEAQAKVKAMEAEFEQKEAILKEAAADFAKKTAQEFAAKESIMFECLEEYKSAATNTMKEVANEYKMVLESVIMEETENYRAFCEQVALEEAANYHKDHESKTAAEVSEFKESLLEKLDQYVETELTKSIPTRIMEAAAEAAAYKPLVEGMLKVLGDNYIKLDSTGHEALKAAKQKTETLNESLNAKTKECMKHEIKVKELEKKVKLNSLTEGMTQAQKLRTVKLLESYSVEQLDSKFAAIKDIIINESVKQPARVSAKDASKVIMTEDAKKQLEKLVESVNGATPGSEMEQWAADLKKSRRA